MKNDSLKYNEYPMIFFNVENLLENIALGNFIHLRMMLVVPVHGRVPEGGFMFRIVYSFLSILTLDHVTNLPVYLAIDIMNLIIFFLNELFDNF